MAQETGTERTSIEQLNQTLEQKLAELKRASDQNGGVKELVTRLNAILYSAMAEHPDLVNAIRIHVKVPSDGDRRYISDKGYRTLGNERANTEKYLRAVLGIGEEEGLPNALEYHLVKHLPAGEKKNVSLAVPNLGSYPKVFVEFDLADSVIPEGIQYVPGLKYIGALFLDEIVSIELIGVNNQDFSPAGGFWTKDDPHKLTLVPSHSAEQHYLWQRGFIGRLPSQNSLQNVLLQQISADIWQNILTYKGSLPHPLLMAQNEVLRREITELLPPPPTLITSEFVPNEDGPRLNIAARIGDSTKIIENIPQDTGASVASSWLTELLERQRATEPKYGDRRSLTGFAVYSNNGTTILYEFFDHAVPKGLRDADPNLCAAHAISKDRLQFEDTNTIKRYIGKDIIRRLHQVKSLEAKVKVIGYVQAAGMSTDPSYYAGSSASSDFNVNILLQIYAEISIRGGKSVTEAKRAADAYVEMIKTIDHLSPTKFLSALYRLAENDWQLDPSVLNARTSLTSEGQMFGAAVAISNPASYRADETEILRRRFLGLLEQKKEMR